jgi:hypothetical protein
MMTVVRLLLAVVVFGLLLVGGLLHYVAPPADQVVRDFVEVEGSQTLGAAITVDAVQVQLRAGRASLHGIEIGNPPGFHVHGARAISVASVDVELDSAASDEDTLVLRRVVARGIDIAAVVRAPDDSNIHAMLRTLDHARIRAGLAPDADRTERRYVVEEVLLIDIELDAIAELSRRQLSTTLADMHLVEPGAGPRGGEIEGLLRAVIAPLALAVAEAAAQHGLDGGRPAQFREAAR